MRPLKTSFPPGLLADPLKWPSNPIGIEPPCFETVLKCVPSGQVTLASNRMCVMVVSVAICHMYVWWRYF